MTPIQIRATRDVADPTRLIRAVRDYWRPCSYADCGIEGHQQKHGCSHSQYSAPRELSRRAQAAQRLEQAAVVAGWYPHQWEQWWFEVVCGGTDHIK